MYDLISNLPSMLLLLLFAAAILVLAFDYVTEIRMSGLYCWRAYFTPAVLVAVALLLVRLAVEPVLTFLRGSQL